MIIITTDDDNMSNEIYVPTQNQPTIEATPPEEDLIFGKLYFYQIHLKPIFIGLCVW